MISIVLIGLSLAMDAATAAAAALVATCSWRDALRMGLYFGFFQFLMPLAGCTLAGTLSHSVRTLGPYISFFLLTFIGVGMIQDAAADKGGTAALSAPPRGKRLAALAIATSIDAFAVGVSFAFQRVNLLGACLTIGGITFCLSVLAAILGGHFPRLSSRKAGIIGGAVLLAMGVKLLLQGLLGH